MHGEQGALLTGAGQNTLDLEVFTLGHQIGFSHFAMWPVVSIPLQSHLFVPFFLQLEVGGVRGMTKPYAIRFFSLFLLYLTSVTLCPDLPLQVAAQVAQFLGTRHSYSAGNIEGHWECVKGWF